MSLVCLFYSLLATFLELFSHHKFFFVCLSKQNYELYTSFFCLLFFVVLAVRLFEITFVLSRIVTWFFFVDILFYRYYYFNVELMSFLCDNDNIQWLNFCTMIQIVLYFDIHNKRAFAICFAVDCYLMVNEKCFYTLTRVHIDKLIE